MQRVITHENLQEALANVKNGLSTLYVPTPLRVTKIDKKAVAKFEKAGMDVIKADKDGRGFRLRSGKSSIYLFAGQLIEVAN